MQIGRLLEITLMLLGKEVVTARELAQRFGVSQRTIYRDIDVLSGAGVPVYMSKGKGGGISLLPGFSLNKAFLSQEDKENISLALQTLQTANLPDLAPTLAKLGGLFRQDTDWVEVDFSPWGSRPDDRERFTQLKEAILGRRVLSVQYVNSQGQAGERIIEPLRLIFKGHSWYLLAHCRKRESLRVFRISRITSLSPTGQGFSHPPVGNWQLDQERPGEQVTLVLRFQPGAAHRVYDSFAREIITRGEDGSLEVTVTFPWDEWVYGYILSFGPWVEVVSPALVRDKVKDLLAASMNLYRSAP